MNLRQKNLLLLITSAACQSIPQSNTYNIYPVAGETYQMNLNHLFGMNCIFTTENLPSTQDFPFYVSNYGTIQQPSNFELSGQIISTAKATLYGNPNTPANQYGFLVSQTNQINTYQLYQTFYNGTNSNNQVILNQQGNTTCYAVEYIYIGQQLKNQLGAICLMQTNTENSLILYYNGEDSDSSNITIQAPSIISSNQVLNIETQVTISLNGTTYLSVLYLFSNTQNNILQIYYFGTNYSTLINYDQLNYSNFEGLIGFYFATDYTLFILYNDKIVAYYLNAGEFNNVSQTILSQGPNILNVFQTATNTQNQLFYIAISFSSGILYLQYMDGYFYQDIYNFFPKIGEDQNIFVTPYICVLTTTNQTYAFSGPKYREFTLLWSYDYNLLQTTQAAYDNYNNVLVLPLNNQTSLQEILRVQFSDAKLTSTNDINDTTQNGSFLLVVQCDSKIDQIKIDYYVVTNSNNSNDGNQVYQIQNSMHQLTSNDFFYPAQYFTGPSLTYSQTLSLQDLSDSKQLISNYEYVYNQNLLGCIFYQYVGNNNGDYFLYIYQIQNGTTIQTYGQNCYMLYGQYTMFCENSFSINNINQPIKQILTTQYTNQTNEYLIAISYNNLPIVTVFQTPYIFAQNFWQLLATIDITSFNGEYGSQIIAIAPLYNIIYIVSQNLTNNYSYLLAVQINESNCFLIASTSQNISNPNIWVNQATYGELIFMNNGPELIILQLVNSNTFVQINNITYPIQGYNSLIFEFLGQGFFLSFLSGSQIYNIYYYPYNNIQTISFNQTQNYTTQPLIYDYVIQTDISASSEKFFYLVCQSTILVYKLSPSSVGSLYTTISFFKSSQPQIEDISAISSINNFDVITVLLSNQNVISLILLHEIIIYTNITAFEQNQYLIQNITFWLYIDSNAAKKGQSYPIITYLASSGQNFTITNTTQQILQQNITGSNTSNSYMNWSTPYYPSFYEGPIDSLSAQYVQQNGTIILNQSMVSGLIIKSSFSKQNQAVCFNDNTQEVIAQNIQGSYIVNVTNNSYEYLYNFSLIDGNNSIIICPYVGIYNTSINPTYYISVCQLSNNYIMIYVYSSINSVAVDLPFTQSLQNVFYSNNILTLCSQTNAYICAFNVINVSCSNENITFDSPVYNNYSISVLQIANTVNQQSTSYALVVPYQSYIQFIIIVATNLTVNQGNLNYSFSISNQSEKFIFALEQIFSEYSQSYVYQYLQLVQTSQQQQTSQVIEVPVFLALIGAQGTNQNFGLILSFKNILSVPNLLYITLQCGYGIYPKGFYYGTTAVNNLIVSLYLQNDQQTSQLNYIAYNISNQIYNGSQCIAQQQGNISMIYYIGSFNLNYSGQLSQLYYPYLQVLANGQVFSIFPENVTQFIQLSQYYIFQGSIEIPEGQMNNTNNTNQQILISAEIQVTAQNLISSAIMTYNITVNGLYIPPTGPSDSTNNKKKLYIILGSSIGGIIVLLVIGYIVYRCRQRDASDQNIRFFELSE